MATHLARAVQTIQSNSYGTALQQCAHCQCDAQIVVTDSASVANQACIAFGQYALLVEGPLDGAGRNEQGAQRGGRLAAAVDGLIERAAVFAREHGLWNGLGTGGCGAGLTWTGLGMIAS